MESESFAVYRQWLLRGSAPDLARSGSRSNVYICN
jgi:hypothetical protein